MRFLNSPSRGFVFLGKFGWNQLLGGPFPCFSGTLHHPLVTFVLQPWLTFWSHWPVPRTGHIYDCFAPYQAPSFSGWEAYLALSHSQERVPWGRLVFHHLALFLSVSYQFVQVLLNVGIFFCFMLKSETHWSKTGVDTIIFDS